MRKEGYYWVKLLLSDWQIMEWMQPTKEVGYFAIIRCEFTYYSDHECEEIDENIITR